jgi:hypothetical protein
VILDQLLSRASVLLAAAAIALLLVSSAPRSAAQDQPSSRPAGGKK